MNEPVKVLCVDDNTLVAEALELRIARSEGFTWAGHLTSTDSLVDEAMKLQPNIVLLDIDLPGSDAFTVLGELSRRCPGVRVVMFSGLMCPELINRAIDAGAWGYLSKTVGLDELLAALMRVAKGGFAMGGDVSTAYVKKS